MAYPYDVFNNAPGKEAKEVKNNSTALNITKVFLYMFIGLFITAVIAFALGYIVYANATEETLTGYLIALAISAVLLIINSVVINFVYIKGKHSILIPGIIYCVLLGVVLSFLTLVIDWRLLGITLAITVFAFMLMSLISFLTKGKMAPVLIALVGLGSGIGFIALFTWIFALFTGVIIEVLWWAIIIGSFIIIMLVTIYDLWRIKKIAEQGQMNNNITLYCAFVMYTDFINVFLRILYFVIILSSRSRR